MDLFYESSSWIFSSLVIVIGSILVCLGTLWLVRKAIPVEELQKNHDVAGFTLSIIGVLYSVILGFTVINAQTRYTEIRQTIHVEALNLADLYRDASFFPPLSRDAIRASLRNYVDYVVKVEWWLPPEKKIRIETQQVMEKIFQSYFLVDLQDVKMQIWYTESISKLNTFMNARLSRQFDSWEHLGTMMWSLLIVGGIITIGFLFFFGLENLGNHMIMAALVTGYISFMLYLVFSMDHVFTGPQGIKPVALEEVYSLFDRWDEASANKIDN